MRKKKFKWKPYKQFLFVEDGSIDADDLAIELEKTNPKIKIIVYRQGSKIPDLIDIKKRGKHE